MCSKATITTVCRHVCTCVSYALQQWVKAHWLFVSLHIHLPARLHTDPHKHIIHLERFMKWLRDDRTPQTLTLIDSTLWISNLNGLPLTTILWSITNYKFNLRTHALIAFGKSQVTIIIFVKTAFKRQIQYIYKATTAFEKNVIFQWVLEVTFQVHLLWWRCDRWLTCSPPQGQSADAILMRIHCGVFDF